MKEELVLRLNTLESLAIAGQNERERTGLYASLIGAESEPYRRGTFQKAVQYCLDKNEQADLDEDRTLTMEIRSLLGQHSTETPFQIRVYDESGAFKRNTETNGEVMKLDEKIMPYVDKRTLENGDVYDYLDMVVELNTKVGR